MAEANGTKEVVEEVRERPPAEVRMPWWVVVSLENPVGWHIGNEILLGLVVAWWVKPRGRDRVR